MNWSWELALVTKIWKKLKFQIDNSPGLNHLILAKPILTGQVQRDKTSPAASGASSQTHCPAIFNSFSCFRDLDKDLKGGLYGLKTFHWSIHVHTVQGFHFLRFLPYYHGNWLITIEACWKSACDTSVGVARHLHLAQISVCKVWSPWDENRFSGRWFCCSRYYFNIQI